MIINHPSFTPIMLLQKPFDFSKKKKLWFGWLDMVLHMQYAAKHVFTKPEQFMWPQLSSFFLCFCHIWSWRLSVWTSHPLHCACKNSFRLSHTCHVLAHVLVFQLPLLYFLSLSWNYHIYIHTGQPTTHTVNIGQNSSVADLDYINLEIV